MRASGGRRIALGVSIAVTLACGAACNATLGIEARDYDPTLDETGGTGSDGTSADSLGTDGTDGPDDLGDGGTPDGASDVAADSPNDVDVADDTSITDGTTPADSDDTGTTSDTTVTDSSGDTATDTGTVDTGVPPDSGPCVSGATATCYSGKPGTAGTGICRSGTQYCIGGSFGPCIGEVVPTLESCNGVDDDCDGLIDNGMPTISCGIGACAKSVSACAGGKPQACSPGTGSSEVCGNGIDDDCNGIIDDGCACVYVSPTGTDAGTCGSTSSPCRTIQWAIGLAGTGGRPNLVCAASTAGCSSFATTYTYDETVTMKNGVSVQGGYAPGSGSGGWTRSANCITRIHDKTAAGVMFDETITSPTALESFTVENDRADAVTAAITIAGSTGAIVIDDVILGGAATSESYGINVTDGLTGKKATPTLMKNAVTGGTAPVVVGVRSVRSAPILRNHCDSLSIAGRCSSFGCGGGAKAFIKGRAPSTGTSSYAVLLQDSPGALVESSAIVSSDCASTATSNDAIGVRVVGNAAGTIIRGNSILTIRGKVNAVGVMTEPCSGASPWIFDNQSIAATSTLVGARGDGVRSVGDCHPRIDSNQLIVGGQEAAAADANGIYCTSSVGIASRCVVVANLNIWGATAGSPPTAAGVRCDDGACARIDGNALINGRAGVKSFGVVLGVTGTFVDRNVIDAGCGGTEAVGVESLGSFARLQNNVIRGLTCSVGSVGSSGNSWALRAFLGAGSGEIDVHSNDLLGHGSTAGCTSRAVSLNVVGVGPGGARGIFRNNILHAGFCTGTTYGFEEVVAGADPRIFQNNDIWYTSSPTALYRDEGTTNLTTIAAVNASVDPTGSNLSVDPQFTSPSPYTSPGLPADYHLKTTSLCIDKGTSSGAPGFDFEGGSRPAKTGYDIGADEVP